MLYPLCLRRISDLRFRVDDKGGQYHHLRSSLDLLAFGPDRLCPGKEKNKRSVNLESGFMTFFPPPASIVFVIAP